ncbi:hypothetical protein BSKO_12703 [Bryopsis sp. KO-2023]|nr:hypothetical protein BSKO_12703 [Bryopsis sp. KO-2023]
MVEITSSPFEWSQAERSDGGRRRSGYLIGSARDQRRIYVWCLVLLLLRTVACQDGGTCSSVLNTTSGEDLASLVACQSEEDGGLTIAVPKVVLERGIVISGKKKVKISSDLDEAAELQCTKGERILEIRSGAEVTLSNLKISGCDLADNRGPIHVELGSTLILNEVQFEGNSNGNGPGVLSVSDSDVVLEGCEFRGNKGVQGGAIAVSGKSKLSIKRSSFLENSAKRRGGSIDAESESETLSITVEDTLFQGNVALKGEGGGICAIGEGVLLSVLENTLFLSNTATLEGGGIFMKDASNTTVEGSNFMANTAGGGGGAFYAEAGDTSESKTERGFVTITMTRSTFFGNAYKRINKKSLGGGGALLLRGLGLAFHLTQCKFKSNWSRFDGGAIYGLRLATLSVQGVEFRDNQAGENDYDGAGGAMSLLNSDFLQESKITITDTIFIENTSNSVRGGGGLFIGGMGNDVKLKENVRFERNHARNQFAGGGGLRLSDGVRLKALDGPQFIKNSATCGGALMGQKDIVYFVTGGIFRKNKAIQGGAICNRGNVDAFLDEPIFEENRATEEGGAFWMMNQNTFGGQDSEAFINDGSFSRNSAGSIKKGTGLGGVFFLRGAGLLNVILEGNSFQNNTASFGGVFSINIPRNVDIKQNGKEFSGNKAILGGAIYAVLEPNFGLLDASLFLRDGAISNNEAKLGGALYAKTLAPAAVDTRPPLSKMPTIRAIYFGMVNNTAMEEGGAVYLSGVRMYVQGVGFVGNVVSNGHPALGSDTSGGGGILLRDGARLDGRGIDIINNDARNGTGGGVLSVDSEIDLTGANFEGSSAAKGGGLYVKFTRKGSKTNITGNFTNNKADFGGGIHVENSRGIEVKRPPEVLLHNSTIEGNRAAVAGGGIFTDDPSSVYWTCNPVEEFQKMNDFKGGLVNVDGDCLDELERKNKRESRTAFGSGVATIPTEVVPSRREISNHTSGEAITPPLRISFLDQFDQKVKGFMITALARSSTPNITLSGQTESVATKTDITFGGLRVTGPPGTPNVTLNLTFLFEVSNKTLTTSSLQIKLDLRKCSLGEVLRGDECQQCPTRQYSFDPTANNCSGCPSGATCDGTTLIPNDGFWHSTSQSPQIHRCLSVNGCEKGNVDKLANMINDAIQQGNVGPLYGQNMYPQCAKGFHGVLCGACDPDYGRASGSQECRKCQPRDQSVSLVTLVWLWALIILAIIVNSNTALVARLEFLSRLTPSRMAQIFGESSQRVQPANSGTVEEIEIAVTNQEYRAEMRNVNGSSELAPLDEVVIANPAIEVLKILLNFLQVTSIALLLNVEWTSALRQLLIWEGAAVNVSAEYFSLDCALGEHTLPKSIRRIIYFTFLPFTLGLALCLLVGLRAALTRKSKRWFARNVFAAALSMVYVFYTYLTRTLSQILNCVSADSKNVEGFEGVSINYRTYWAEDTDVVCWEGHHLSLLLILGIPMLLAVSAGAPVGLLIVLTRNRDRLNKREFLERYGFLYKSYNEAWRYWEVVIMTRKALLAVVVVFSFELGGNLQGILAVVVLMAAMAAHLYAKPYSDNLPALNVLEACSLIISIFVFVAGVIFNDPRTSDGAKIFITVFIFILTFLLLTALVHRMYIGLHIWLKLTLVKWEIDPSQRFHVNAFKAVGWCNVKATDMLIVVQQRTEHFKMIVRRHTL